MERRRFFFSVVSAIMASGGEQNGRGRFRNPQEQDPDFGGGVEESRASSSRNRRRFRNPTAQDPDFGRADDASPARTVRRARRRNAFRLDPQSVIDIDGLKFRVKLDYSRRWETFRTDRRMYRVRVVESTVPAENHLVENLRLNNGLERLLSELLGHARSAHRAAGRTRDALATLTLSSDSLTYPIISDLFPLYDDQLIVSFLEQVKMVLHSKQEVSLDESFNIDVTVIDTPDNDRLLWTAGGGGSKVYRDNRLWDFPRPKQWKELGLGNRGFYMMPTISPKDRMFHNCCLLFAIVFSMAENRRRRLIHAGEVDEASDLGLLHRINATGKTRLSKAKAERTRTRAAAFLRRLVKETVENYGLDVEAFRDCHVPDDSLRNEADKLGVNLWVYKDSSNFQPVLTHPETFDRTKESVHVLLVSLEQGFYHAASITVIKTFDSKYLKQGTPCLFCKGTYTQKFVHQHKCGASNRCDKCRRLKKVPGDYIDSVQKSVYCHAPFNKKVVQCQNCEKHFGSVKCFKDHRKFCFDDSKVCPDCRQVYRISLGHSCDKIYCHTCREHVYPELSAGDGLHFCPMKKPQPAKKTERLFFFDMETVAEGPTKEHKINAVGCSFERERGVFSEVYFYDDEMLHPEDGKVNEDCYTFKYWTPGLESRKDLWEKKPPKYLRKKFSTGKKDEEKHDGGERFDDLVVSDSDGEEEDVDEEDEEDQDTESLSDNLEFAMKEALEALGDDDDGDDDDDDDDDGEEEEEEEEEEELGEEMGDARVAAKGSALAKFLDFILSPKFYHFTMIAHAASRSFVNFSRCPLGFFTLFSLQV